MKQKLIIGAALLALVAGGVVFTGTFSGVGFGEASCDWQDLEIDGQEYSSVDELRNQVESSSSTSWSVVQESFDFRTEDGVVEFRSCTESGSLQ